MGSPAYLDVAIPDLGIEPVAFSDTESFPVYYLPHVTVQTAPGDMFMWSGFLSNGSMIAPGNYTQRVAGLRPLGDPKNVDDWVVMVFPCNVLSD